MLQRQHRYLLILRVDRILEEDVPRQLGAKAAVIGITRLYLTSVSIYKESVVVPEKGPPSVSHTGNPIECKANI